MPNRSVCKSHRKRRLSPSTTALVQEQGGRLIGERIFARETGLSRHYWQGGFWRSWSALHADAGHEPNSATEKTLDDTLLRRFAELALERNEIPSEADLILKRKEDLSSASSLYNCLRNRTRCTSLKRMTRKALNNMGIAVSRRSDKGECGSHSPQKT